MEEYEANEEEKKNFQSSHSLSIPLVSFPTVISFHFHANIFVGYFVLEECGMNILNPTIAMEIGQTYTFIQKDRTNYFHRKFLTSCVCFFSFWILLVVWRLVVFAEFTIFNMVLGLLVVTGKIGWYDISSSQKLTSRSPSLPCLSSRNEILLYSTWIRVLTVRRRGIEDRS